MTLGQEVTLPGRPHYPPSQGLHHAAAVQVVPLVQVI